MKSVTAQRRRNRPRVRLVMVLAVGALLGFPSAASAHGGEGEPQEGYLLVQQALGYLAHEGMDGIDPAMEKVDDALATSDQEGVDVALVTQARASLQTGDVLAAENTLQKSITVAVSQLMPAVGAETGTTVVTPDLPGRSALSGLDWVFLAVSAVLVLVGVALAAVFRPEEPLRVIRAHLGDPRPAHIHAH